MITHDTTGRGFSQAPLTTNRYGTYEAPFRTLHPVDYKKEIGRRLATERERLGLKANEVAGKLGWIPTRLGNYERGERLPGPYEIKALAKLYGVAASYLGCLDEDGEMTNEEMTLLRAFRALPENARAEEVRHMVAVSLQHRTAVGDQDRRLSGWEAPVPARKKVKR